MKGVAKDAKGSKRRGKRLRAAWKGDEKGCERTEKGLKRKEQNYK